MRNIYIPQINEYSSNPKIWNRFLKVIKPVFQSSNPMCFNFKKCGFIAAEGIVFLAGIKFTRDFQGYQTTIADDSIESRVKLILDRSGFLDLFKPERSGRTSPFESTTTTLPIYRQQQFDINGIAAYFDGNVLNRTEMPSMSNLLRKEIRKAFFEIFGNIFTHSKSLIGGLVCGQVFPHDKKIQIVFYDAGVGIAKNVRNSQSSIKLDEDAIEWALRKGTSTLSSESVSRGLGLYLIRMFLRANEGEFRIYSNKGAITENNMQLARKRLPCSISGTLIDMRIIIRDDIKYTLFSKDEI